MDHYSILDQNSSPTPGSVQNAVPQLRAEADAQPVPPSFPQGSVSAAIAAVNAAAGPAPALPPPVHHGLRFPGDDGGRSLAEMAQRDLDAALQLLAERAQYITGASGSAIALRRDGRDDMLCRASAGTNAPELGALLSTQSGLSGESVRTRMPLRCDDTERDPRVNRDGCRELGIASVLILPILGEDQVLGVFELFSGQVNAFTERDLSALQRLGEMVETAVQLAHAAENPMPQILAPELQGTGVAETGVGKTAFAQGGILSRSPDAVESDEPLLMEVETEVVPPDSPEPKKPILWSSALSANSGQPKSGEVDKSHIPPMLRSLRQCKACGFPVSEGRTLCVECEEKKWRGQLRMPSTSVVERPAAPAKTAPAVDFSGASQFAATRQATSAELEITRPPAPLGERILMPAATSVPVPLANNTPSKTADASADLKPVHKNEIFPAKPNAEAAITPSPNTSTATQSSPSATSSNRPASLLEAMQAQSAGSSPVTASPSIGSTNSGPHNATLRTEPVASATDMPILSAGIGHSQSWLSANKYILGALVLVAAVVAAIVYLR
jgi:hypothetical protein